MVLVAVLCCTELSCTMHCSKLGRWNSCNANEGKQIRTDETSPGLKTFSKDQRIIVYTALHCTVIQHQQVPVYSLRLQIKILIVFFSTYNDDDDLP